MSNSRKQLIAQIAMKSRLLQQQQAELLEHKEYFHRNRLNFTLALGSIVLASSFCLGWKFEGKKWITRLASQLVEVTTLVFMTYFRRQIVNLLSS